ncbi:MAG: alpha/beta fold hydrolase [Gammaproteobacteria bacterium]|nr:alpha/beta fold hydrolase [Gammaproteobacteria bacterium]
MSAVAVRFPNAQGQLLAGLLEMPAHGKPRAYALFAHCFTCGKDVRAAVDISRALCMQGIAVLRFDFTGLGESQGTFADTNLSSNISDLVQAAAFLEQNHQAPGILVGHSLGGTAVLEAAHQIPSCVAVATVAAPANPEHVANLLGGARRVIEQRGQAEVLLAGRKFLFKKSFLEDLENQRWQENIHALRKPLLILHSPSDALVDISNAGLIFAAALHPKSFVALSGADHLLSRPQDSEYVGLLVAAWASKYLGELGIPAAVETAEESQVLAQIGRDHYRTEIIAGRHGLLADEPPDSGGGDLGPSPYGYLTSALGACTAITLRMYADHKNWPLEGVRVQLTHEKIHARDCENCDDKNSRIDRFERVIELQGALSPEQQQRLLEIADHCPVHRTLRSKVLIETRLKN